MNACIVLRQALHQRGGGMLVLLAMASIAVALGTPAAKAQEDAAPRSQADYLHEIYAAGAKQREFFRDAEHHERLTLVDHPIMGWNTEGSWSGDVFVWTRDGRPEVIGCVLSGPRANGLRNVYDEYHLLSAEPIAPVALSTGRHWTPTQGLALELAPDAPQPASSAAAQLSQMRKLSRSFSAHRQANDAWELRLLPQPLFRYGEDGSEGVDGGLFAYVWTIGAAPEFILWLECRRDSEQLAWHYAPIRFSHRPLWLKHNGQEVGRVPQHHEPARATSEAYTTAFSRSISADEPDDRRTDPQP